jgi:phosphate transport system substrate-binding protein
VSDDKYAIGYGGIGYKTEDVRAVPLIGKGKNAIEPNMENAYNGKYPMARFLYVYINYKPNTDLDPLRREFLRFVLSKEGQEIVLKDGYIPITAAVADKALDSVGLGKQK